MSAKLLENDVFKKLRSTNINYDFNKQNGFMAVYGKTLEENPTYSPFGPFIADIELSTICANGCKFCYKDNTNVGKNMSLETFKSIFGKLPKVLTQIAFGIGDLDSCPDLFPIMDYCRNNDYNYVIPNITINKCTDEQAEKLSKVCGAVAVSLYDHDTCYDSVKRLTDTGMKQVNIHVVVSEESFEKCLKVIDDSKTDPRLSGLNAIVFLMLKNKGRGSTFKMLSKEKYQQLVNSAISKEVRIGFDSCSAFSFLNAVEDKTEYEMFVEECESARFSLYINVEGEYHHCSFAENGSAGISVLNCNDFMRDVWFNKNVVNFREKSIANSKKEISCQLYDLTLKEEVVK